MIRGAPRFHWGCLYLVGDSRFGDSHRAIAEARGLVDPSIGVVENINELLELVFNVHIVS